MRKKLIILLAVILLLAGCEPRTPENTNEPENNPEEQSEVLDLEPEPENEPEEPKEKTHEIEDKEEISEAISITRDLLNRASVCEDIFMGSLPVEDSPPQKLDDTEYYLIKSDDFIAAQDIGEYWYKTFADEGKAKELFDTLQKADLYASINGELHIKSHDDISPMTMGFWETNNIRVISFEQDKITVAMETLFVGEPNGEQKLEIVKAEDQWVLNDSFFLD